MAVGGDEAPERARADEIPIDVLSQVDATLAIWRRADFSPVAPQWYCNKKKLGPNSIFIVDHKTKTPVKQFTLNKVAYKSCY